MEPELLLREMKPKPTSSGLVPWPFKRTLSSTHGNRVHHCDLNVHFGKVPGCKRNARAGSLLNGRSFFFALKELQR